MTPVEDLRVWVPPLVWQYPPATGVGRMWSHVLGELEALGVSLKAVDPSRRRWWRPPDVWLADGHQGPLPVRGPTVMQLHEAPWNDPAQLEWIDPGFVAHYRPLSEAAARRATRIVTPSAYAKGEIVSAYDLDPATVHVAHHGVDPGTYHPGVAGLGRGRLRPLLGEAPYLLFVSAAHPRKNVAAVRRAALEVARAGHPHRLVMVLSAPADRADGTELLREATADLPGFPGRVVALQGLPERELAGVIAEAELLCAPSWAEGFGLVPLEAMACGTPVVVSDRGSMPEVVGDAGVVCSPEPDQVADCVLRVVEDAGLRERLAAAGLARSQVFTWKRTAERWRHALVEAAGRRPTPGGRRHRVLSGLDAG